MAGSDEVGFRYWNRWQVAVCALVVIIPTVVALVLISKVKKVPLSVNDLWVPCWRRLSPVWLLIYRGSALVIMCGLMIVDVLYHGAFTFYFYTQWTFSLVLIYFALATIVSARGCWQHFKTSATRDEESNEFLSSKSEEREPITITGINKSRRQDDEEEVELRTVYLGYIMQTVYQVCAGAAILTDVVFWGLLLPFQSGDNFRLSLLMGLMHSVNVVFLLLDTVLNKLSFPWYRAAYFVLWSCLYIVFQWVLHACGFTWWPYAFLELSTPWAPLWYFALALVHVPCYGAYVLIVKAKDRAFSALFPQAFGGSSLA